MVVLSAFWRALTSWYALALAVVGVAVAVGLLVFFFVFPGTPKIGVINIPYTVLNERSAYVIGEYLGYARRNDSIKAVVIRLTSPGGGAAASEHLYGEIAELRKRKPVVLMMNDLVASGGFMMAMGASHTYTTTSALVGNVGVISFVGPLIPSLPDEGLVTSGPYKSSGSSRRDWTGMVNQLADSFAGMVLAERGKEVRLSRAELMEARIYSGVDAVHLGLADEIGSDADAFNKAAELSGIANYGLVDVNVEVQRKFAEDLARVLEPLAQGQQSTLSQVLATRTDSGTDVSPLEGGVGGIGGDQLQTLRELVASGVLSPNQEDPLPGMPVEIDRPNFYYLYLGHDP